ncbi:hypothetical protein SteCoe_17168 [Stentor coeruleus]|uniref:RING-type domain-containing protein n=1 Tax=Stentor coeruleus TaxID=5963 RepID=A0A1R2BZR9_9CILI|nr:hypothetical protein SteCoe_17168 [Stentor coeruleus]
MFPQNSQIWNEYSNNTSLYPYNFGNNPSLQNFYQQAPTNLINHAYHSEHQPLNNFGIEPKKTQESKRLSEAINSSQIMNVKKNVQVLMKKKRKVKIKLIGIFMTCDAHSAGENRFRMEDIYGACFCSFMHKFCLECITNYVKNMFATHGLGNNYECMACAYASIGGTKLLTDEQLTYILYKIFGPDHMAELIAYTPISRPTETFALQNLCNICKTSNYQIITLCSSGHKICLYCINNWINNIGNDPITCPISKCNSFVNIQVLIKSLAGSDVLIKIKSQLQNLGFNIFFCFNCQHHLELSNDKKTVCKNCNKEICNNCGKEWHFGLTCFYFVSQQDYEVIDLPKPSDPLHPKSLLEQEYLNAQYAFDNYVNPGLRNSFNQAKLIVNKTLEKRYAQKKITMAQQCGGPDKVNEIYIWHGSRYNNYDAIMRDGLKVGGVDGIPVAVGTACGYGVYSASTPNTPIGYANDSKWVLACLAMKGINSTAIKNNISTLNDGLTHSYATGDWVIFFTKEQLLPRFLVEYKIV